MRKKTTTKTTAARKGGRKVADNFARNEIIDDALKVAMDAREALRAPIRMRLPYTNWRMENGNLAALDPPPAPSPPVSIANVPPGYNDLAGILIDALDQAAVGKGKTRHANGKPFDRQPILEIGRMVGPGYALGQAMKKAQESKGMVDRGERHAAVSELFGAINYLAATVILIREGAGE